MKVSIITPSFNQAQFLRDNLNSVVSQTYSNVEHIIVDPGSNDGSRNIASEYAHITPLFEKDKGQSDGICKGFLKSTGDILVWLNSDDYYPTNDVIEKVVDVFKNNPDVDIVYGGVDFVSEDNEFLKKGFVNKQSSQLFESFQYQVGIVQPGVFWRRRVFEKVGGPSQQYEYCMDYELWVRFAANGFKWKFLDKTLAHHRWWDGMKTSSQRGVSLFEHFKVCMHYFGYVHWKWLDRYADYIGFGADGVVNAVSNIDENVKLSAIQTTIKKVINQNALKLCQEKSKMNPECKSTLDYIQTHYPEYDRYIFDAKEFDEVTRTSADKHAEQRPAWNIFDCKDSSQNTYKGYDVPNNFYRLVESAWFESEIQRTKQQFTKLKQEASDICIVVGNGPSLNHIDFKLFDGHDVIISNFAINNKELLSKAKFVTVVNDLVAEQGALELNFCEKVKIVPFWLANSINPSKDTFYVSSTVVPEIKEDFVLNSSWRSTVTFFNIQLAYALGYKKVILVGVDNSYVQPLNVKEGDLITQLEDDENHFDPNYFKGKDWQAADTVNMEKMYLVAANHFKANDRDIVNCTVGGELETFRRGSLEKELFLNDESLRNTSNIKVLVLDTTPIGHESATGQLKKVFFSDWESNCFLQIWSEERSGINRFYMHQLGFNQNVKVPLGNNYLTELMTFNPDVIYIRPVDNLEFLEKSWEIIQELNVPYVLHIMDDWPTRIQLKHNGREMINLLDNMVTCASRVLSICQDMSIAYEERYGRKWTFYRNAISLEKINDKCVIEPASNDTPFVFRYLGGAATDMNYQSILDVAFAVNELIEEGFNLRFEIYTMPWYKSHLVSVIPHNEQIKVLDLVEHSQYQNILETADALLIAYNFDKQTFDYTSLSFANKTPECLGTGKPVLVYGNSNIATVRYFKNNGSPHVVEQRCRKVLKQKIKTIVHFTKSDLERNKIWAYDLLRKDFNLHKTRSGFEAELLSAKHSKSPWKTILEVPDSIRSLFDFCGNPILKVSNGYRCKENNSIIYRNKRFNHKHTFSAKFLNNANYERVLVLNLGLKLTNANGNFQLIKHMKDGKSIELYEGTLINGKSSYVGKFNINTCSNTLGFSVFATFASIDISIENDITLDVQTIRIAEEYESLNSRNLPDRITELNQMFFQGDKLGAIMGFAALYDNRKWTVAEKSIEAISSMEYSKEPIKSVKDLKSIIENFVK